MGPLVLTVRESCDLLHMGPTKLYELLNKGELRSARFGRKRLVLADSLREYVERHTVEVAA